MSTILEKKGLSAIQLEKLENFINDSISECLENNKTLAKNGYLTLSTKSRAKVWPLLSVKDQLALIKRGN